SMTTTSEVKRNASLAPAMRRASIAVHHAIHRPDQAPAIQAGTGDGEHPARGVAHEKGAAVKQGVARDQHEPEIAAALGNLEPAAVQKITARVPLGLTDPLEDFRYLDLGPMLRPVDLFELHLAELEFLHIGP